MRVRCGSVIVVVGVLVGVAGCSTGGGAPAGGVSMSGAAVSAQPTAQPTAPPKALCDAVRTALNAIPKPTGGDNLAGSGSSYYTALVEAFVTNNGADPVSHLMTADAQKIANDYQALYTAQSQGDSGGWDRARSAVAADVKTMVADEPVFDRACGVAGLLPSPVAIGSLPQPSASPSPAAPPEQVTYSCTGHGGVDITYGPNGTQHSASSLPFHHTEPLTAGALYYVTTAQLQGGGSVSCTTTVQTVSFDGTADDVSNTGSADGGYNIATAEVCSGVDGWEKC